MSLQPRYELRVSLGSNGQGELAFAPLDHDLAVRLAPFMKGKDAELNHPEDISSFVAALDAALT